MIIITFIIIIIIIIIITTIWSTQLSLEEIVCQTSMYYICIYTQTHMNCFIWPFRELNTQWNYWTVETLFKSHIFRPFCHVINAFWSLWLKGNILKFSGMLSPNFCLSFPYFEDHMSKKGLVLTHSPLSITFSHRTRNNFNYFIHIMMHNTIRRTQRILRNLCMHWQGWRPLLKH